MTVLDRNSPIPLYYQLKNVLLTKIQQAEWEAGDLIPSEQELQDTFGLSRTTVRQTLSELVNEGWLSRHRGRGTFVTHPTMTHDPVRRLGASEYLAQQGIQPGWQVLSAGFDAIPDGVHERLNLAPSNRVYTIQRLRLANGEPIGHHQAFIPESVVRFISEESLSEGGSLRYLRGAPQMEGSTANRTIEATLAGPNEVKLLGSQIGDPILSIDRLVVAADSTPLELLWAAYRGDRFKYQITI